MRNRWLRQFHFTKNERKGLQALLLLSAALCVLPSMSRYVSKQKKIDYSSLEAQLEVLQGEPDAETNSSATVASVEAFFFDPNTANFDDFVALGLSERISNRILNYRDKGGKFFDAADFAKIYGLPTTDFERLEPYINIEKKQHTAAAYPKRQEAKASIKKRPIVLSKFNPNTATFDAFLDLGLSERTAHSILNYRENGGNFKHKRDFKKIYTLPEQDFERLYAYIDLPQKEAQPTGPSTYAYEDKMQKEVQLESAPTSIDINTATAEEWQTLRGIGPAYARRIVNFREKLGGFATLNQVAETYGLPDSVFQRVQVWLQSSEVFRPININTATEHQLLKHPYISKKQAKLIVAYREQHGAYGTIDALLHIKIFEEKWLEKVRPYFTL